MLHLLEFSKYEDGKFSFQEIFPGIKDEWVELNFSERKNLRTEIFELVDSTYRSVFDEGHFRISSPDSIINDKDMVFWGAVDIDGDPNTDVVIFGSERYINGRSTGYKISGWGHDGSRGSKRFLMIKLASLLKDKENNFWIEVSGSPAKILTHHNFNIPEVPKEKVEAIFPNSKFEWTEDGEFKGFYTRTLQDGSKTDREILLGNPAL